MFGAFIKSQILFALAGDGSAPWWNYPGFEAWKFFNLFLFVGVLVYILRRPISEAMRARREGIRRDLMRAQEERNAALAKLEEVEARLARLDAEVASVREQARTDAIAEQERIALSTEADSQKLREQAVREIESAGKAARHELRRYAAEQSVRLAEEMIRRDIRTEDDTRLVNMSIEELGGSKR
ncbi:MAG: ATP synthase F0 subunit B [Pyrinomonadaceae bacterium]|nr:ATP synthase F0 subunit B [Pyrinomonadaceae bacterium]